MQYSTFVNTHVQQEKIGASIVVCFDANVSLRRSTILFLMNKKIPFGQVAKRRRHSRICAFYARFTRIVHNS